MHNNVACAWGSLFEPIARKYFEKKHSVSVFGQMVSLNLAENDPLFGKITCSPDGYFLNSDNELVLLEFKCPFKREFAKNHIPSYYSDQIQTGLALSGESVKKGLFVDNYLRICSLKEIEPSPSHNPILNDEDMEFSNLYEMRKLFTDKGIAKHFPVAVFAWKLLNITEIWEQKKPNFLESIQKPVECFHKNLGKLKKTLNDFVYEEDERAKPTIIENKGDDAEFMKVFLMLSFQAHVRETP